MRRLPFTEKLRLFGFYFVVSWTMIGGLALTKSIYDGTFEPLDPNKNKQMVERYHKDVEAYHERVAQRRLLREKARSEQNQQQNKKE